MFLISSTSFSQEDVRIKTLLEKVEVELKRFESNTIISRANVSTSNRKVVVKGQNGQYTIRDVIKYYFNGMKKEKLQVFKFNAWGRSALICSIVKINDQNFYIEYIETNEDKALTRKAKEVYVVNKCYQKISFDSHGYTTSTENYLIPISIYSK